MFGIHNKLKKEIIEKENKIAKLQEKCKQLEEELELEKKLRIEDAKRIEESKYNFVNKAKHEMKLPIAVLKGYADILNDDLVEDEEHRKEILKKLIDKIDYMNMNVTSLFAENKKSGISADNQDLYEHFSNHDLIEIVCEVIDEWKNVGKDKNIDLTLSTVEKNIFIFCEYVKIKQLISNLVNNSLKYMGKSGKIQISVAYSSAEEVTLIVRDNGMGVSAQFSEKIFEEGEQYHNIEENHGLGLAICKDNVEKHGGKIWCKTDIGKGMTMYIVLPVNILKENSNVGKEEI